MSEKISVDEGCIFDGWRGIYIPANVILLAYDYGFRDEESDPIVSKHYPDFIIAAYDNDKVERDIADLECYIEIYESAESYLSDMLDMPDNAYLGYNEYSGDWGVWIDEENREEEE